MIIYYILRASSLPSDILWAVLCDGQPLQVAAGLQPRSGGGLQRKEEE